MRASVSTIVPATEVQQMASQAWHLLIWSQVLGPKVGMSPFPFLSSLGSAVQNRFLLNSPRNRMCWLEFFGWIDFKLRMAKNTVAAAVAKFCGNMFAYNMTSYSSICLADTKIWHVTDTITYLSAIYTFLYLRRRLWNVPGQKLDRLKIKKNKKSR